MTTPTPPGVPTRPPAQWIARYFVDPPNPADLKAAQLKMAFGGGGLVLGVVLLAAGGDASFLGAVGLVVGFILGVKGWNAKRAYDAAYALAMPRPSDAEIDQLIATDAFSIVNRSLPQLGLTPADLVTPRGVTGSGGASFDDIAANSGPQSGVGGPGDNQMVVWGPAFPCNSAFGDDGRMRYSKYEFMVICPTHYLLAIYRCELDLYSGQLKSEQTHEYHYQDVVAVRTASVPLHRGGITIQPRASQRRPSRGSTPFGRCRSSSPAVTAPRSPSGCRAPPTSPSTRTTRWTSRRCSSGCARRCGRRRAASAHPTRICSEPRGYFVTFGGASGEAAWDCGDVEEA